MDQYIYKSANPLPSKECQLLIKHISLNLDRAQPGPLNEYTQKTGKYFYKVLPIDVYSSIFGAHLANNVRKYIELQRGLRAISGIRVDQVANLQKYKPGEHYSIEHCENSGIKLRNRVLAWMYYLNTIRKEHGGGTSFPQQELILQPEEGVLYIWPAGFTHTHQGLPCDETKYIITGWCSFIKA